MLVTREPKETVSGAQTRHSGDAPREETRDAQIAGCVGNEEEEDVRRNGNDVEGGGLKSDLRPGDEEIDGPFSVLPYAWMACESAQVVDVR